MSKSVIINPVADKHAKERADARQMDVINLARNLVIHSTGKITAEQAFDYAAAFKAEEEARFPVEAL